LFIRPANYFILFFVLPFRDPYFAFHGLMMRQGIAKIESYSIPSLHTDSPNSDDISRWEQDMSVMALFKAGKKIKKFPMKKNWW
jgi:hypothetical protein